MNRLHGAVLASLVTLVFHLLWWNRFLGGTGVDGVFLLTGLEMLEGRMPYKDVTLLVPPLDAIVSAVLAKIFGVYLIAPRALGLVMRVALSAAMFWWLTRLFRPWPALMGALTGMIVFSAGSADPLAGYNHDATFWAVMAGFAASYAVDFPGRRPRTAALLAGIFASLSFLTKQTTGLGAAGAVLAVLAFACIPRKAAGRVLAYCVGWTIPAALVAVWLAARGAWPAFVDQLFVSGPASKGSLLQIFLRPLAVAVSDPWLRQELAAALLMLMGLFVFARQGAAVPNWIGKPKAVLLTAGAALLIIVAALAASVTPIASHIRIVTPQRIFMFFSLFGSGLAFLFFAWKRETQLCLMAAVSIAVAYTHSLSFVVTESMVLPSLAFLVALGLDRLASDWRSAAVRWGLAAGCAAVFFTASASKLAKPFGWYGWEEPPALAATHSSALPELAGLRMSAPAAQFFETLTSLVRTHSAPSDQIYAFFYLPLTHILSRRMHPTSAFNHFIDIAPDRVCRSDAALLRANPPAIVVYTPLHPGELENWEKDFRAGRPSGQRDLIATLEELIDDYKLAETLYMPGTRRPVRIYVRPH